MLNQPSKPDFYGMSEAELLEHCGDKAERWAEAFCQIKELQGWSAADIDKSLMLCWFANAIENSTQVRENATEAILSALSSTPQESDHG